MACLARRDLDPPLRRYGLGLVGLSLLDAWLSSTHVYGIGRLEGLAARLVPLGFVLAGDLRYLLLVTSTRPDGRFAPGARSVGAALLLALIVPVTTQVALFLLPEAWNTSRIMFLIYEVAFLGLALALLRGHPSLARGSWLRRLSRIVVAYYALWAAADILILSTGSDLGFGLRLLPNWLYYGGLIAGLAWLGPGGLAVRRPGML